MRVICREFYCAVVVHSERRVLINHFIYSDSLFPLMIDLLLPINAKLGEQLLCSGIGPAFN